MLDTRHVSREKGDSPRNVKDSGDILAIDRDELVYTIWSTTTQKWITDNYTNTNMIFGCYGVFRNGVLPLGTIVILMEKCLIFFW